MLLAEGYSRTSVEAIAKRARISKRTFYHRFRGKPELFEAVVRRLVQHWRAPFDALLDQPRTVTLEQLLTQTAKQILSAALSPQALALHRLILSEAPRFPELARVMNEHGAGQGVLQIAGILEAEMRAGRLGAMDPRFAAEQFLHLVLSGPQRRALGLGKPLAPRELQRWMFDTVRLFLAGLSH